MDQAAVLGFLLAILSLVLALVSEAHDPVPRGEVDDVATCNSTCMLQRKTFKVEPAKVSTENGESSATPAARKIFVYWNYPQGINPLVELNVMSWLKYAPAGTELIRINATNFRSFVPDAPDEVFKLPYSACWSDVVRAAVLYHHGGLYMDTDFLVMKDLSSVFAKLDEGWNVVTYSDNGGAPSAECKDHYFSSNFMAAQKGNVVSGTWWENIKTKLTRTCGYGEFQEEKICCHSAFLDEEPEKCHIPWAFLEHLKAPETDPDAHYKPPEAPSFPDTPEMAKKLQLVELGRRPAQPLPEDTRIFCLQGNESLTPHLNGEVYWQKWDSASRATAFARVDENNYDHRFQCRDESGDLVCDSGQWGQERRVFPDFYGRVAYHLFFSTCKRMKATKEEMLQSDWMIGELYRRSLGETL